MRTLASFRDAHRGGSIVVCGCGSSLKTLQRPERFITIGVNDVGRLFDPDYLVVVDPREQFKHDRFRYVETSRAGWLFTQRDDLGLAHPNVVRFRLGEKDGTDFSDPEILNYSVTTPYVAICLAIHMGASNIGLIGVDFTDNHFFGTTGPHGWAPYVGAIDAQFDRLSRAAFARGVRVFNLSAQSRLTCLPKMDLDTFAQLDSFASGSERALRIVSYATTPLVGVPAILARCINARTPHRARCIWAGGDYGNGISCAGDLDWNASPAQAAAELEAADVVVLHNGKTDARHRAALAEKPVITVAHNYIDNVDPGFVRSGFPGLVVGQYQATLPEFAGWSVVPNPVPLWEESCRPAAKPGPVAIAYTPAGKHDAYPPGHPLYWHGKGYAATLRVLDRLQARHDIRIHAPRDALVPHADALAMKRGAHIVIDECVTGSYHRNSLEGLAAGAVVVNGVGLRPGVLAALRHCARDETADPFVAAGLGDLEEVLERLIYLGPDLLALLGAANRGWMEQHWEFGQQWHRFWQPAIDGAISTSAAQSSARRHAKRARTAARTPELSVVIVSLNEGEMLRRTVQSVRAGLPDGCELIVVDDGSEDGSADFLATEPDQVTVVRPERRLGAAKARNLGAAHAQGKILVFSDAHIAAPLDWAAPLRTALADPDIGAAAPGTRVMRFPDDYDPALACRSAEARGYGMKWSGPNLGISWLPRKSGRPFPAPLLGGAFLAIRRNLFAAIGGFDPGLEVWGSEDAELSMRLWMLGFQCLVVPDVEIAHQFRTKRPYRVDWEPVLHNKLRLAGMHFSQSRRRQVSDSLSTNPAFPAALARLEASDVAERRERFAILRRHDDDWFFTERFRDEPMPGLSTL